MGIFGRNLLDKVLPRQLLFSFLVFRVENDIKGWKEVISPHLGTQMHTPVLSVKGRIVRRSDENRVTEIQLLKKVTDFLELRQIDQ